ncbi:hemopexin repeat-containing protein [Candidatus Uabimicrobium sp. HlEnr_7]|uniref:hemopexin repeat-containing protein n=1 Tax=Candidatus Uabimicrobium helgolandensis TaxID=3095367 RepID=UPI003558EEB6
MKLLCCGILCLILFVPEIIAQRGGPRGGRGGLGGMKMGGMRGMGKVKIPRPKSNFKMPSVRKNSSPFSNRKSPFGSNKPPFGGDKPPFGGDKPPFGGDKPSFADKIPFDFSKLKIPQINVNQIFSKFPTDFRRQLQKELGEMSPPNVAEMVSKFVKLGKTPPLDPRFWEGLIYSGIVSKAMQLSGDLRTGSIPAEFTKVKETIPVDPQVANTIISQYAKSQGLAAEYEKIMKDVLARSYGVQYENSEEQDGDNNENTTDNQNNIRSYFFKDSKIIRYKIEPKKRDRSRAISKEWRGSWSSGIDAAVNWGNNHVYFFKGSQFIRFNARTRKKDMGPSPISSHWPDLWPDGIDAALNWGNGDVFFFKGEKTVRYTVNSRQQDGGPVSIRTWFPDAPSNLDAALNWNNTEILMFKGSRWLSFDINTGEKNKGPKKIKSKWRKLPSSGIDAATFWTMPSK